jgi:hypothetical protein
MTKHARQFLRIVSLLSLAILTMATPETPSTTMKTIYLIRHAESEENRRIGSLGKCFSDLGRFRLPAVKDVTASMGLINLPAQLDSDVLCKSVRWGKS